MTISLTPEQEQAIQKVIQTGIVRSVNEFIDTAIDALPRKENGLDKEAARVAVARIVSCGKV